MWLYRSWITSYPIWIQFDGNSKLKDYFIYRLAMLNILYNFQRSQKTAALLLCLTPTDCSVLKRHQFCERFEDVLE